MRRIILFFILFWFLPLTVHAENSAYLTNLTIEGYNLSPEFNKYNNSYSVAIDEDTTSLDIKYTLEDETAEVEIIGNDLITESEQTVQINITNNTEKQTYTIYVNKNISQNVANINEESLELEVPVKRNMKLITIGLVIVWIALAYIFKKVIFFR